MNNKKLGGILVIVGVVIAGLVLFIKIQEDQIINKITLEQGSCFLEDGTCLHEERGLIFYVVAWIVSAVLMALGFYLIFFEKSQQAILSTLENQKIKQSTEEKFNILLRGLNADEKNVIQAVKEQDGITQQTLRLRTDLHKSKLSIILEGLEKKDLIARKQKGKTKQVFLKFSL